MCPTGLLGKRQLGIGAIVVTDQNICVFGTCKYSFGYPFTSGLLNGVVDTIFCHKCPDPGADTINAPACLIGMFYGRCPDFRKKIIVSITKPISCTFGYAD